MRLVWTELSFKFVPVSGSVHQKVWAYLEANGTSAVFGNPGSTELPFFANWPERVRWVMALQEASVVGMADGYAQATGRPAFVTLHSAAGLGNGMNGLFTAFRNCSPLVVMAGQRPGVDEPAHQPQRLSRGHPNFRGQLQPVRKHIREALTGSDLVVVLGAPVFLYHVPSEGPPIPDGTQLTHFSQLLRG